MDIINIILKGGWAMVPLLICSILSVAVTVNRFLFWKQEGEKDRDLEDIIIHASRNKDEIISVLESKKSSISRILLAGLKNTNPTKAMEAAALREIPKTKANLVVLDTIITLAPLLGLLGTIFGMIKSFNVMSISGTSDPMAVTGGVAESLIATATGLLIAIVTLVPYNYFLAKTEKLTDDIEYLATKLELTLGEKHGN